MMRVYLPILLVLAYTSAFADSVGKSSCAGKKAYIAGPAVFYPDGGALFYDDVRRLLAAHDVKALIPIDNELPEPTALAIRAANIKMIEEANVVFADLSPFRSREPDVGTSFEVGYAAALHTNIFTYSSDLRTMVEKYNGTVDEFGFTVEDFSLPFNLMLYDGRPVYESFTKAFGAFMEKC